MFFTITNNKSIIADEKYMSKYDFSRNTRMLNDIYADIMKKYI